MKLIIFITEHSDILLFLLFLMLLLIACFQGWMAECQDARIQALREECLDLMQEIADKKIAINILQVRIQNTRSAINSIHKAAKTKEIREITELCLSALPEI